MIAMISDDEESDGSSDTFYDATSNSINGGSMEDLQERPPSPAPLSKPNSVSIPCDISCPQPPGIYHADLMYL